ncbi:hypothetical protein [Flavobacterium degerlachei]|jgi:uncharacterized membrane protein|uniref:Uncharacterized protein n=1 Tax=Flavobacterium degerlachei TaxID=229203 RepID=A0A1H2R017_9FLAO|nr:hypothetical protein [Flavobacterium degerlachei]SDW12214.1 hypothetical protein SAMN05444338_101292 [Flavobacterium degerlachei]
MKLTTQQIEYVENYIISKDIKWYELQVELTDHMVTSMEEFWEKDPELTFHQVKYYAEDKFGRNGFKVIEEERTQILRKEFRRAQLKMIAEYFKFPKIILGILLGFLAFKASFYFDEPVKFVAILFGLLAVLIIPAFYSFYINRKINGKRFLELNINHGTFTGIFGLMYWVMYFLNSFKESVQSHPILILALCCLWVVGILFLITGIHLQKKTIENVKRQYQLT